MGDKQLSELPKISAKAETSQAAVLEAFDAMRAGLATPKSNDEKLGLPEIKIKDSQPTAPTQDQIEDELLKNPAIFHGVLRSSFQNWNKNYWGNVEHSEVTRVANDPATSSVERKAAQLVDKNFDLFARLYGSKKLETGDIDEFAAALKLDRCGSSLMADATAKAARYGIGVYGLSKMMGSDQAGWNSAVGITSSVFASLVMEGIRQRDREKISALNYFNIPKC